MRFTSIATAFTVLTAAAWAETTIPQDYFLFVNKATGTVVTANWSYFVTANSTSTSDPSSQTWLTQNMKGSAYSATNILQNTKLTGIALDKQVQTMPDIGAPTQLWTFTGNDNDGYRVENVGLGGVLSLRGENKTDGAEVVVNDWIPGANYQIWFLKPGKWDGKQV